MPKADYYICCGMQLIIIENIALINLAKANNFLK